jgi:hypothetical protein
MIFQAIRKGFLPLGRPEIYENHAIHCFEDLRFLEKHFFIALRFASTPTRATPARVGDPGAARKPTA